jgi:hemolysin III
MDRAVVARVLGVTEIPPPSMNSPSATAPAKTEAFSLPLFLFTVGVTVVGLLVLLRLLAPGVWAAQFLAEPWLLLPAFAAVSLGLCFVEFFFHRYVLHLPAIPGLSRLYRQHTLHHALTRIGRRPGRGGRTVLCVENKFPIVEE